MGNINTAQAALKLGISVRRVQILIKDGTLAAERVGRDYVIDSTALSGVTIHGKAGRPRKSPSPKPAPAAANGARSRKGRSK
jgi:excisionase family DNA binding protein